MRSTRDVAGQRHRRRVVNDRDVRVRQCRRRARLGVEWHRRLSAAVCGSNSGATCRSSRVSRARNTSSSPASGGCGRGRRSCRSLFPGLPSALVPRLAAPATGDLRRRRYFVCHSAAAVISAAGTSRRLKEPCHPHCDPARADGRLPVCGRMASDRTCSRVIIKGPLQAFFLNGEVPKWS